VGGQSRSPFANRYSPFAVHQSPVANRYSLSFGLGCNLAPKLSAPLVATFSLPSSRPCGSCCSREFGNKMAAKAIKSVGNEPMGGSPVWKRNDCWKDAEKVMKGLGLRLSTDIGDWLSESHTESSGTRKRRKMQFKTLSFRSISLCEISVTSPNFGLGFTASSLIALWLACHLRLRNR